MDDYYNEENESENPFEGIQQEITDVMLDRVVSYTCRKIATTQDPSEFAELYKVISAIPLKGILQFPKPLIDEFWKFVNLCCLSNERSNASHGLRALLEGITATLCKEDEFQIDFHGLSSSDIAYDYEQRVEDLKKELSHRGESPAKWSIPLMRDQRNRLSRPKGDIDGE